MSRGQYQPRSQTGRRVLERCKNKGNIDIIDVDKDNIDVVIVDAPETSRQGSRGSRVPRSNWCPNGVISIDDEEERGIDDNPRNVHGDATNNSPMSEESDSDECLMFVRKGNNSLKGTEYLRMYHEMSSSRNCFGLGSDSDSACESQSPTKFDLPQSDNSESGNSDCEIMEDGSGNIRELWEKAAFRRKISERGQFGFEYQASVSGSSSDPGCPAEEATQMKVDAETCIDNGYSNPFAGICMDSSQRNSSSGKNPSFSMSTADELNDSLLETEAKTLLADPEPATDSCHEEPGIQKSAHTSEKSSQRTQSIDETLFDCKGACFEDGEVPVPATSLCEPKLQQNTNVNADGAGFADKDEEVLGKTSLCTDELHGESSFQDKEGQSPGKASPCKPPHWNGRQVFSNSVGLQDYQESQSQCDHNYVVNSEMAGFEEKEKSDFEEKSFCNNQPSDGSQLIGKSECFFDNGEANFREPVFNSNRGSGNTEKTLSSHIESVDQPWAPNSLIGERERHKETDEYRRAVEEEWASRQQQLQIQAEEAQRLRKRRKAENLRLLDMEKRQKQRLEEIRESQKKDEETIHLKEQLRAEIRKELDKMELRCRDMASLLRGLGIRVEGGAYPISREVNAAYKQALLRFHPDRASRTDIRQQVEAEETFKLISRFKEKLLPVAY